MRGLGLCTSEYSRNLSLGADSFFNFSEGPSNTPNCQGSECPVAVVVKLGCDRNVLLRMNDVIEIW
jgi:hypothetical protein